MNFITGVRDYIIAILAIVIIALFGRSTYHKYRADRNAKRAEELEDEIQANDITNEVKTFQEVNKTKKERTDETIKTSHTHIEPNTTYSL